MRDWAARVPISPHVGGYGVKFHRWLASSDPQPYNSFGNGSAMRVSSIGWLIDDLPQVEQWARLSALPTHNHPEGIKGAQAVATSVYLARTGRTKADIKQFVEETYGYDLSRPLDQVRETYVYNERCQETVPEAIIAYLDSVDFVDAIRNAVSLGGDADTLAAITGAIAEAEYGVPETIKEQALERLHPLLAGAVAQFEAVRPPV